MKHRLLTLAAGLTFTIAAPLGAQVTALTGATLIDGSGAPPQANTTIVMEAGRIRDIGPSATVPIPSRTSVVDIAGRFVVPGIINAHGHVGANRDPQLRQYAVYGVTTTTSIAFDGSDIIDFQRAQARGDLRGARILTVRYRFMSPPFIPGSEHKTAAAGRAKVDEVVRDGTDFVKVWIDAQEGRHPKLTREFVGAVFDQARKHGKTTMAHVVEYDDAKMAIEEGANILVHNIRDREIDAPFIELLKQRNVSVISTLAREEAMFVYGEGPAWIEDPFFRRGLSDERFALLQTKKRDEQAKDPARERYRRALAIDQINLKKLVDAGVRVGFGTDSGGDAFRFFIQGFFEHRQMNLMTQAGLTPMQIIQIFSKGSAEVLGIERDFGTLARGKAADLLVVDKNPLEDITNMRAISAVYLGGRKFE